jgi:hypothetical protein
MAVSAVIARFSFAIKLIRLKGIRVCVQVGSG